MKGFNFDGYRLIVECRENDLVEYLGRQIPKIYGEDNCIVTRDYFFAKGTVPVILCAHMDTVFSKPPETVLYDPKPVSYTHLDVYKRQTANSTSTMHRIMSKPITLSCFEFDDFNNYLELSTTNITHGGESTFTINDVWDDILTACNKLRDKYLKTKDMRYWKELIRILSESWIQRRTCLLYTSRCV